MVLAGKKTRLTVAKQPTTTIETYNYKGKLEKRVHTSSGCVVEFGREEREGGIGGGGGGSGQLAEEKWRFQVEILREECNFLRKERKFPLKKLEKNGVRIERTLKSALQNLASVSISPPILSTTFCLN